MSRVPSLHPDHKAPTPGRLALLEAFWLLLRLDCAAGSPSARAYVAARDPGPQGFDWWAAVCDLDPDATAATLLGRPR